MGDYPPWPPVLSALLRYGVLAAMPYAARRATAPLGAAGSGAPDWFSDSARRLVRRQWDPEAWKLGDGPRWWADATDRLTRRIQGLGLLDYVRREAERAGIEPSLPFFDRDLVEFSLAVPPEQLLGPYLRKPVLRAAMEGLMPDSVRLRLLKTHFDEFVVDAVDGPERPLIRELLGSPAAEVRGYVRPGQLQDMLDRPAGESGGDAPDRARDLWRLAAVEYWLQSLSGTGLTGLNQEPRVVHS